MIQAIFIDVDGTLLSHSQKKVPDSARRALNAVQQKGIKIFLATGRHPIELAMLPLEGLHFDARVLLNGSLVLDADDTIIHSKPLSESSMKRLSRAFAEGEESLMFVTADRMYVNKIKPETVRAQASISTPVPPVGEYRGEPVYQGVVYGEDAVGDVYRRLLPECALTRWHEGAFDIIPADGGKSDGISALLKSEGLDASEIICIGDGENDADMIAFAGIGIAMGNADPKSKAAADYVTADIDDDGLAKALTHFGLISEV